MEIQARSREERARGSGRLIGARTACPRESKTTAPEFGWLWNKTRKSAGGPAHSKTLARMRGASWSAVAPHRFSTENQNVYGSTTTHHLLSVPSRQLVRYLLLLLLLKA